MNKANAFTLDIVTPQAQVASQEVEMVVVPGAEGDFGALLGHAPFISSIRPGVIKVYKGNSVASRLLVTGGFAEITGDRCTVLATEVFDFATTSKKDLEERLKSIKSLHDKAKSPQEKVLLGAEAAIAEDALSAFVRELDSH